MKILLAGSTGFIGREVLDQCLQHPAITSLVALSRRPLEIQNPKLSVAVTHDFLDYPADVIDKLEGVEGCIWSLGKAWMPSNEQAREVCVDYTMVAVKALTAMHNHADAPAAAAASGPDHTATVHKKKIRFVYLSGGAAERDQTKPLWFKQDYRRIRGTIESLLLGHARTHADIFEAHVMRPGMVLAKESSLRDLVRGLGPSVKVDKLAAEMVRRVVNGEGGKRKGGGEGKDDTDEMTGFVVENGEILSAM
ncbi:MAG: hypothetical protein LQ349_003445 [Xanthoria aureola]|nr:MAG: hypothetical protein LQ349_003445 [Xanthoria aureola]